MLVNGDRWTVVDVAPAAPLAEMVAVILEEEGFLVMTKGPDMVADVFTHMGTHSLGTTYVLVPETDGPRALAVVAETVTDYEGEALDEMLTAQALEAGAESDYENDDDEDDF